MVSLSRIHDQVVWYTFASLMMNCCYVKNLSSVRILWPLLRIWFFYNTEHKVIKRTGIICKKNTCYMYDSSCTWCIVKYAKIFWSYVEYFWITPRVTSCRILIGLCKQVFINIPIIFLDRDNKVKFVPAAYACFLEFLWKEKKI